MKKKANRKGLFIVVTSVENTQIIQTTDGAYDFTPSHTLKSHSRLHESVALPDRRGTLLPDMLERQAKVLNKLGLHARPAAEFVRAARTYKSTITIIKNGDFYSASSILDVLSANLDCGSSLTIRAEGPDAEDAVERLFLLLEDFRRQEEGEGN